MLLAREQIEQVWRERLESAQNQHQQDLESLQQQLEYLKSKGIVSVKFMYMTYLNMTVNFFFFFNSSDFFNILLNYTWRADRVFGATESTVNNIKYIDKFHH
jgi:hypothetical protein